MNAIINPLLGGWKWRLPVSMILFATAASFNAEVVIAEKGKTQYRIVIPVEAIASERYAAEELQSYLEKISGAKLPIVTDAEPAQAREIVLGNNARLAKLGVKVDWQRLGSDGFTVRTRNNALVIAGGRPRGTLFGVYGLLEEKLGVRWFTPECEQAPRRDRLVLPSLDETQVPVLENREVFWREVMRSPDFAARHRLSGHHSGFTEKHGGRAFVYFPFVHSLDMLIPQELFKEHPEYFPLINGKRVSGYVQRCLSNQEVIRLAVKQVRAWIKEHPEATILSVSQNDTFNACQCPACKALDDAEGSQAASMIRFVNAIAENITLEYPHLRIDTLAYQYTRKPPKHLRPHPNVIVRLCSIECCFAHPLETCASEANRKFREDILAWEPVAPKLYVWDYTPNFAHYQQPFPNFDSLQANVKFFVKHNVRGLFEQGNYSSGGFGEMGPLRAYLLAKLLWNPETDLRRHQDEFLNAYYGKAAPKVRAFLALEHAPVREQKFHAHIYDPPTAPYLTDAVIEGGDRLLAEGEQLAETEAEKFRVRIVRLPLWYVKIASKRVTGEAREALLTQFLTVARQAGISNISEGRSIEEWVKQMEAKPQN
jgi:hypothetical protein